MSVLPLLREPPTVRELLVRATWQELDRIAARYGVQLSGRRRTLAVERLAATLERPDQLRAAYGIVPEATRATLGLLMLLGGADDERALATARERLLAARPDLEPALGRVHLANEVQTLTSLGLCFRDRRRLVVPHEVLRELPMLLPPATVGAIPAALPQSYSVLRYTLEQLSAAIEQTPPLAAHVQRAGGDRATAYQPLLMPSDVAAALSWRVQAPASEIVLWLSLLEALDAVAIVQGRWQVQPGWTALREQPPRAFLAALLKAWQRPRNLSDLARTDEFVWMCTPHVDVAAIVAQHEAQIRVQVWRWLRWCGDAPIDIAVFCRTFAALHSGLLLPPAEERNIWIAQPAGARRTRAEGEEPEAIALALVGQLLSQLRQLGCIVADEFTAVRTPTAVWLDHGTIPTTNAPPIYSLDATSILVQPLLVAPATLRLIELAGQIAPAQGDYLGYRITTAGLARLLEHGHTIGDFEAALLAAGAQLDPDFQAQLTSWAARSGRLRLHRPLTVLVTDEHTPLTQVLAAAGIADASELLGPDCALLNPEDAEAAIEQLRARGFWPREIGTEP